MRPQMFITGAVVAGMLLSACSGATSSIGNNVVPHSSQLLAPAKTAAANAIENPGFETGKLTPWVALGQRAGAGTVVSTQHHAGKYSALLGTTANPAVNGPHGVSQTVTVPKGGVLTFWHEGNSTDEAKYGYEEIDVYSGTKKLGVCWGGVGTSDLKLGWKKNSCSLSKYAGKKVTLEFYVNDNGYAKAFVNEYLDDVTLSGS